MPNFYSPEGNFEVWETKPKGYFTEAEWLKKHPLPETKPKQLSDEQLAIIARSERDYKLVNSDKYLLPDFPIDATKLEAVKKYRQELRDITKQSGFPSNITWPKNPMEG